MLAMRLWTLILLMLVRATKSWRKDRKGEGVSERMEREERGVVAH